MRVTIFFAVVGLLLGGCHKPKPTTFSLNAASLELDDVKAAIDQAQEGDTVTLPEGEASWTQRLEISKAITLQGQTTVEGAGTADPVVDQKTLIIDDTDKGLLRLYPAPNKPLLRVTGIAFKAGARTTATNWSVLMNPAYPTPVTRIRVDHCYFDQLKTSNVIGNGGWSYPVVDHNVVNYKSGFGFMADENNYGGKLNGNGAWADYSWFGSDKFFFIETNTIRNMGTAIKACMDTTNGARAVFRYNYVRNGLPADHGTEGQEARFDRCREIYNNEFHFEGLTPTNISARGGTFLLHDNLSTGLKNSNNVLCNIGNYRANSGRSESVWGQADGTSVWDENDTEGDGTFVEGHPPHLFDSGTATAGTAGTMTDASKNWTVDRWVGYSIQDTASAMPHLAANITANTSDTITYSYYSATDTKRHLVFAPGITYEIHRCLRQFDMSGTGKGDLIEGAEPVNTTTGRASYPHYLTEPSFAWNNKHETGPGQIIKQQHSWMVPFRDFYELGLGFNGTPQQVKDILTAEINGVAYTVPFVYPHPLVGGGGGSSPSPAGSPSLPSATPSPSVTATVVPGPSPSATVEPSPSPTSTATVEPSATGTPMVLILRPGDTITITVPKP